MKIKIVIGIGIFSLLLAIYLYPAENQPGAIESARLAGEKNRKATIARAKDIGITCEYFEIEECSAFIARTENNPQLKAVFLKAKEAEVRIKIDGWNPFSVGSINSVMDDGISINASYPDAKIIAYLRGE